MGLDVSVEDVLVESIRGDEWFSCTLRLVPSTLELCASRRSLTTVDASDDEPLGRSRENHRLCLWENGVNVLDDLRCDEEGVSLLVWEEHILV